MKSPTSAFAVVAVPPQRVTRTGTKRYFCPGCGHPADGPGRYCEKECVARDRSACERGPHSKEKVLYLIDRIIGGTLPPPNGLMNCDVREIRALLLKHPYDDALKFHLELHSGQAGLKRLRGEESNEERFSRISEPPSPKKRGIPSAAKNYDKHLSETDAAYLRLRKASDRATVLSLNAEVLMQTALRSGVPEDMVRAIEVCTSFRLDRLGAYCQLRRVPSETDDVYRARLLNPGGTRPTDPTAPSATLSRGITSP
jgi:hypothetical protein